MKEGEEEFKRLKSENQRTRRKDWNEKVSEISLSFSRARKSPQFTDKFYSNLFFLKPSIEKYFVNTKWKHQRIAIEKGIDHLLGFLEGDKESFHRNNIVRISVSHSIKNMGIHPHDYYYWIDAMIMTLKEFDQYWYSELEYYTRECLFFPISFIISLYHKS